MVFIEGGIVFPHQAQRPLSFLWRRARTPALRLAGSIASSAFASLDAAKKLSRCCDGPDAVFALTLVVVFAFVVGAAESGCAFDCVAASALTIPGHVLLSFLC